MSNDFRFHTPAHEKFASDHSVEQLQAQHRSSNVR